MDLHVLNALVDFSLIHKKNVNMLIQLVKHIILEMEYVLAVFQDMKYKMETVLSVLAPLQLLTAIKLISFQENA